MTSPGFVQGFRGTVHVHSTVSYDGHFSYEELRSHFLNKGLQFLCVTEHIEHLAQSDVDAIIAKCQRHSDSSFLFVPGIEMDLFVVYFLGLGPVRVDFSSGRSVFDSLREASRLCILSHPIKAAFVYPRWIVDACDGVEILNTKHDGHHYFRFRSERLLHAVRREKPHAIGLAGMDFHGPHNDSDVHLRLTREGPLTDEFILGSLARGDFAVFKGNVPFHAFTPIGRTLARGRQAAMDAAHTLHRVLRRAGLPVPRHLKRAVRRLVEGGR